jgi:hypothetical protein
LATLLTACPPESVTVLIYGQLHTLWTVTRDVWIRDVPQPVRVVVITTKGRPVILLSTDRTLAPEAIIHIYALRFALELSIREAKQHGGLGEYQCTSLGAMTRFVSLSLLSVCLGRLTLLTSFQAEWLQGPEAPAPLSVTRLSRAVRRFVLRRLFQPSASSANCHTSETIPEELIRLVA